MLSQRFRQNTGCPKKLWPVFVDTVGAIDSIIMVLHSCISLASTWTLSPCLSQSETWLLIDDDDS